MKKPRISTIPGLLTTVLYFETRIGLSRNEWFGNSSLSLLGRATCKEIIGRIIKLPTLVAHDLYWTTDRLARRNLPRAECCQLCDQEEETIDHILAGCVFARQFWRVLLHRAGLAALTPQLPDEKFHKWWSSVEEMVDSTARKGLNSLIIMGAWTLWKHRNVCVFNGASPNLSAALSMAGEEIQWWEMAGARALSLLTDREENFGRAMILSCRKSQKKTRILLVSPLPELAMPETYYIALALFVCCDCGRHSHSTWSSTEAAHENSCVGLSCSEQRSEALVPMPNCRCKAEEPGQGLPPRALHQPSHQASILPHCPAPYLDVNFLKPRRRDN
ncbi:hypothetical protein EJB05_45350, partial [Eragrostis curvula]